MTTVTEIRAALELGALMSRAADQYGCPDDTPGAKTMALASAMCLLLACAADDTEDRALILKRAHEALNIADLYFHPQTIT